MISQEIKQIAIGASFLGGQPRFGLVESVDPTTYTAKVTLQPDGTLTSWLPIRSSWIGNGWGLVCPPMAGDQVIVAPHEGDADNLVIIGSVYSQAQMPPAGVPGEFWLVDQTGSCVKLQTGGVITVTGTTQVNVTGPTVNVTAVTEVKMTTPLLKVSGDIIDNAGTNSLTVAQMRTTYNEHTHNQPNDSAGDGEEPTDAPNQLME